MYTSGEKKKIEYIFIRARNVSTFPRKDRKVPARLPPLHDHRGGLGVPETNEICKDIHENHLDDRLEDGAPQTARRGTRGRGRAGGPTQE